MRHNLILDKKYLAQKLLYMLIHNLKQEFNLIKIQKNSIAVKQNTKLNATSSKTPTTAQLTKKEKDTFNPINPEHDTNYF